MIFIKISWLVFKLLSGHYFVTETVTYKLQRDIIKIHKQELWFLHSACHRYVLNICTCMKFLDIILNGFKVIERTQFCHINWYLQSSKGNYLTLYIQELWFLHCAYHPMLDNISMKFHEGILNGFQVTERTRFCHWNCYLPSSKGHNSKHIYPRVMVLALCTSSNVG